MPYPIRPAGLGLALVLGACGSMQGMGPEGGTQTAAAGSDSCGAAERQGLVGRSVGGLEPSELPKGTRVLFPGMTAKGDPDPARLNVTIGKSDTIARVYCG